MIENGPKYFDLEWLLGRAHRIDRLAAPLIDACQAYWRTSTWHIDRCRTTGPELCGPGGFGIRINGNFVIVYHLIDLSEFASNSIFRLALRRTCQFIADHTGSRSALYTHELMPIKGSTLSEAQKYLRTKIGPPASRFEELQAAEEFGPRAWYVDSFEDLPGRKIHPRLTLLRGQRRAGSSRSQDEEDSSLPE